MVGVGHPDSMNDGSWRQQAKEVSNEDDENSNVEEVAADHQTALAQQLAGAAAPTELIAIEAQQATQEEHSQADVGVVAKQEMVEIALKRVHYRLPLTIA